MIKNIGLFILVIITAFIGELFQPFSTTVPIAVLAIQSIGTIIFIIIFIRLINKHTNNGQIFSQKLELTRNQVIYLLLAIVSFVIIYATANFSQFLALFSSPFKTIIASVTIALSAGFFEEYFVRGYLFDLSQRILNYFKIKKYTLLITSIVTSILFGLIHLGNISEPGATLAAVHQQVFYAICLGIFFAALRLASNTIYLGAILHFIFDLQATISGPPVLESWYLIATLFVPVALLSLVFIYSIDTHNNQNILRNLKAS